MADIQGRMTPLERALYGVKEPALSYGGPPSPPRPTVTAWPGADLDAYFFHQGMWRHCQTGAAWLNCGGDLALGTGCGACSFCNEQRKLVK